MRHRRSTFDIRVTMLHDGRAWHWLHEARLSPEGSDVSNVWQGGQILVTEDLLLELVGSEEQQQILYELKSESFGLAAYLERLHPGDILEVAFDFSDRPGRRGYAFWRSTPSRDWPVIGSDISVFDKRPEREPLVRALGLSAHAAPCPLPR